MNDQVSLDMDQLIQTLEKQNTQYALEILFC